ncbi:MAG: zf-HC2 domain-containing protein [Chitinivibrionia bacterium]|nr:zf-HC2 domain-containing protein [Chitinivibrionia bacterium]
MKCRKALQFINDLLDNALSDGNRAWLEAHLRECRSCERLATQMRESLGLVRDLPLAEPS